MIISKLIRKVNLKLIGLFRENVLFCFFPSSTHSQIAPYSRIAEPMNLSFASNIIEKPEQLMRAK